MTGLVILIAAAIVAGDVMVLALCRAAKHGDEIAERLNAERKEEAMSDADEPQRPRSCAHMDDSSVSLPHVARISTVEALDRLMTESGQEKQ